MMDKGVSNSGTLCPGGGDRDEGRCVCGRPLDMVSIFVSPTTGGQFELKIASSDNVDYLKRLVSKRLRVPKERICLLYRERHLREGSLDENMIVDGAKITLLPSVETGLLTQRPEQSVMQALESLNDGQVNDFLSGKAPLNLTMRLGDHMMLIQLQLSTVSPNGTSRKNFRSGSQSSSSAHSHEHHHHHHHHHHYHHYHHTHIPCPGASSSIGGSITPPPPGNSVSASLFSQSPVCGTTPSPSFAPSSTHAPPSPPHNHTTLTPPTQSSHRYPHHSPSFPTTPPSNHHHHHHHYSRGSSSGSQQPNQSCSPLDDVPIVRGCPHQMLEGDPAPDSTAQLDTKALAEASRNLTQTLKQLSSEVLTTKPAEKETSRSSSSEKVTPPTFLSNPSLSSTSSSSSSSTSSTSSSSSASSSSSSSSSNATNVSSGSKSSNAKRQGAIIESMHHHGKGVYSGTFSGTLNPALQDRQGRPKRDISTIIHILNDLLCATPQYRRHSSRSGVSSASATLSHAAKSLNSTISQVKFSDPKLDERIQGDSNREMEEESMDASQVTRTKLEQLRFIMEERRQRRKARREARATPYHTTLGSPSNSEGSNSSTWSSEATTLVTKEVPKSEAETEDANTLLEMTTGTVVA